MSHLFDGFRKRSHSKRGRKFTFHGSFSSKESAKAKEREVKGSFILEKKIHGHNRFMVLTEN